MLRSARHTATPGSPKKSTPWKSKSSELLGFAFEDCKQDTDVAKQPNQTNISVDSSTGDLRIIDSEYRGSEKKDMDESAKVFDGLEIEVNLSGDDEAAKKAVEQEIKQT